MRKALEAFRKVKSFTDDKSKGRDWNAATDMVIKNKAAFQIMGDWAKGEFLVAGQRPGIEFTCTPAPGTANTFAYVIDAFAMFQLKGWEAQKAQGYLAYVLLGKEFQESFNLRKGSIPVRNDVSLEKFDECGKAAGRDFNRLMKSEGAIPSAAVNMTLPTALKTELEALISEYWNNDAMSTNETMEKMSAAVTRQLSFTMASSITKTALDLKARDKK